MAAAIGPLPRFWENRDHMLRVIRNHRRAAYDAPLEEYEGISHFAMAIDPTKAPGALVEAARHAWDAALEAGETNGFRNAQATVLAPTGTIGLLMDCDTTGVEPDFALVKFKKLAGGGYFKIANQSIASALRRLGYSEEQIDRIVRYVVGTMTLDGTPHVNRESLSGHGLPDDAIDKIEATLPQRVRSPPCVQRVCARRRHHGADRDPGGSLPGARVRPPRLLGVLPQSGRGGQRCYLWSPDD